MADRRRELQFNSLDEIVQDAQWLSENGYEPTGEWDLAQTCGHLADWMRFPVEGFPQQILPIRLMLWMMKVTSGRRQLKKFLSNGMGDNGPTMPSTVKAAGATTDEQAIEIWLLPLTN